MSNKPSAKIAPYAQFLSIVSLLFAVQAVSWVVMGSFDPFGIYDSLLSNALFGERSFTPGEKKVFAYGVGLLGATTAGFFVLFHFIARHAYARGEAWSHRALTLGLLTWFFIDSAFSLWMNASFNVFIVNLACLLIIGVPLLMSRRLFRETGHRDARD